MGEHQMLRNKGLVYLVLVAVVWVAGSYAVQSLVKEVHVPPLLLTWIANSVFAVLLPVAYYFRQSPLDKSGYDRVKNYRRLGRMDPPHEETEHNIRGSLDGLELISSSPRGQHNDSGVKLNVPSDYRGLGIHHHHRNSMWLGHLKAALAVCPLWFMAQYCFNESLARTSVSSNSILSSTAALFTFFFSVCLGRCRFSLSIFAFVALTILGTALVTFADERNASSSSSWTIWGDVLVLLSALCYATYSMVFEFMLPADEESSTSIPLFFGFMGMSTLVFGLPVLLCTVLVHDWFDHGGGGDGPGTTHISAAAILACIAKGLVANVGADYFWGRAMLLCGPVLTTVGLALQVPLATTVDFFLGKLPTNNPLNAIALCLGAVGVTIGFIGVASRTPPTISSPKFSAALSSRDDDEHNTTTSQNTHTREEENTAAAAAAAT